MMLVGTWSQREDQKKKKKGNRSERYLSNSLQQYLSRTPEFLAGEMLAFSQAGKNEK